MDKLPTISVANEKGDEINLHSRKNKWLVLFFYPKDMTSGCSQEAADFGSFYQRFQDIDCDVYGVSPDSSQSHQKFIDKLNLPYSLLADSDRELCKAADVWKEKSMYGRKYFGVERSTFIFDHEGNLINQWRKVKIPGHVEDVYNKLKTLVE